MQFDSSKDAVFGKMLVFGIILGFPGLNWDQNWTKTGNYRYVLFPLKPIILTYCSNIIFPL